MKKRVACYNNTVTDWRYTKQQTAINAICKKLGVVPYRPDYHAKDRDCNTVLIYTSEAHEYNRALDKEYRRKYGGLIQPDNSEYKLPFCCLTNTDINGLCDLQFMNRGAIDLRGSYWMDHIEAYITKLLPKQEAEQQ